MAKPLSPKHPGQLQLAQRIHQVLVQAIDHAIEVERLLTDAHYARDVLLVCDALVGTEAPPLATQFRMLPPPAANVVHHSVVSNAPGHARQTTDWSRDTSGFGVSRPPPVEPQAGGHPRTGEPLDAPAERRRNWLPRWRDSR